MIRFHCPRCGDEVCHLREYVHNSYEGECSCGVYLEAHVNATEGTTPDLTTYMVK